MTTTPDYEAIDWALENVEGARPEKPSPNSDESILLWRDGSHDDWIWKYESGATWDRLDELDALAILRDWWCEWVVRKDPLGPLWTETLRDDQWRFGKRLVEYGIHPDRTTAIALLVRRVYEATKETP